MKAQKNNITKFLKQTRSNNNNCNDTGDRDSLCVNRREREKSRWRERELHNSRTVINFAFSVYLAIVNILFSTQYFFLVVRHECVSACVYIWAPFVYTSSNNYRCARFSSYQLSFDAILQWRTENRTSTSEWESIHFLQSRTHIVCLCFIFHNFFFFILSPVRCCLNPIWHGCLFSTINSNENACYFAIYVLGRTCIVATKQPVQWYNNRYGSSSKSHTTFCAKCTHTVTNSKTSPTKTDQIT